MNSMARRAAAAVALALAAGTAAAQTPQTGAFVSMLGSDTVSVEKFTRTADHITGENVTRSPRTIARSYNAVLRPDGSIARFEMVSRAAGAPTPLATFTVTFTADSVLEHIVRGDSATDIRLAARNAVPLVNGSYVVFEQAMMRARAMGAGDQTITLVPLGGRQTLDLVVHPVGADSMLLTYEAGPQHVATDAAGQLLGWNGLLSTEKYLVTRTADANVQAATASFAQRDQAGQAMGTLSPRDSVVVSVGGARVAVNYGRPRRRGRTIWGDVVPWDQVWRTGANEATAFTTTRDLLMGGTTVPAGSYTLWTVPSRGGWKLVINKQTGQWGTEYDAAQDFARIDIRTRPLSPAAEAFTIRLDPRGAGGVLRLQWADTEAYVPFTVK